MLREHKGHVLAERPFVLSRWPCSGLVKCLGLVLESLFPNSGLFHDLVCLCELILPFDETVPDLNQSANRCQSSSRKAR